MELNKLEKYYREFSESYETKNYDIENCHMQIDELNEMFIDYCANEESNIDTIRIYAYWLNEINSIPFEKWYS